MLSFSPSTLISPIGYFVTQRGAQGHTTCIVGIVIVIGAVRIDIIEVIVVISGTEPPPSSTGRHTEHNPTTSLRQILIAFLVFLHCAFYKPDLFLNNIHPIFHNIRF